MFMCLSDQKISGRLTRFLYLPHRRNNTCDWIMMCKAPPHGPTLSWTQTKRNEMNWRKTCEHRHVLINEPIIRGSTEVGGARSQFAIMLYRRRKMNKVRKLRGFFVVVCVLRLQVRLYIIGVEHNYFCIVICFCFISQPQQP